MAGPVSVVRVVLRAGVHYVGSEGLVLTPDDSGTAGGPVEYVAHPGEQVTISGGVAIPAEAWVPAMELSGAWKVNLTALGATELGNMSVPWEGAAPTDGLDTSGDTGVEWKDRTDKAELFYDSRPMVLARWPNIAPNGSWVWAHTHAQFPSNCTPHKEPMDPVPKFPSTSGCRGFTWRKDRPPPAKEHSWADAPDGFLHGYFVMDWSDTYTPIAGVDLDAGAILLPTDRAATMVAKATLGARYMAINILEETDSPEEYFIDRSVGTLYFRPPHATAAQAPGPGACVSQAQNVVRLLPGTAHITFRGLRIEHARGTAVAATPADGDRRGSAAVSHISLINCTVANSGGNGIEILGRQCLVSKCEVQGVGGTAINVTGGLHMTLTPGENLVDSCWTHDFARVKRTYNPGIYWAGVGNNYSNNIIERGPHVGVLGGGNLVPCPVNISEAYDLTCGGNNCLFVSNLIQDVALETDDNGGFYSCGQRGEAWIARGNVLAGNTFRRVRASVNLALGHQINSCAYFDDQLSGWRIDSNTFDRCQVGVMLNGGRENNVVLNNFTDCDSMLWFSCPGEGGEKKDAVPGGIDNEKARATWNWEQWRHEYGNISVDHPGVPVRNVFNDNHCCRCQNFFNPKGVPSVKAFLDPKNGLLGTWRNNTRQCYST